MPGRVDELRRNACPGVVDAMSAADGWLMRVRVPGGAVDARQLDVIAHVSSTHGAGVVEITSRGNLQLRGISDAGRTDAARALIDVGLTHPDPASDARRAIVAPALTGHDPTESIDVGPYAAAVEQALIAASFEQPLPAKFSVVIDGGGRHGVRDVGAQIAVGARGVPGRVSWWATFSGDLDTGDAIGLGTSIDPAGLGQLVVDWTATPPAPPSPGTLAAIEARSSRSRWDVGVHRHRDADRCNVIAAPFLGRLRPDQVTQLAALARRAPIRLTHRRSVAVVGVRRPALAAVLERLTAAHLSVDPDDAAHTVTACTGQPGCAAARADTLTAAASLVAHRRHDRLVHEGHPPHRAIHLSGCEKLCGAPSGVHHVIAADDGTLPLEALGAAGR